LFPERNNTGGLIGDDRFARIRAASKRRGVFAIAARTVDARSDLPIRKRRIIHFGGGMKNRSDYGKNRNARVSGGDKKLLHRMTPTTRSACSRATATANCRDERLEQVPCAIETGKQQDGQSSHDCDFTRARTNVTRAVFFSSEEANPCSFRRCPQITWSESAIKEPTPSGSL
jgi:hypothetical protein